MGGTKPTMDGLRAAVKAHTVDIRRNDKDRCRVDVVCNQESINDPRHYVGIYSTGLVLGLGGVNTHIHVHVHTGKSDNTPEMIILNEKGVPYTI